MTVVNELTTHQYEDDTSGQWQEMQNESEMHKTIIDDFEAQVRLYPDKPAIIIRDNTISYRQLNDRANQLAAYLTAAGIGREKLVCICLEQSWEKVVSMLAVLKAGGAYVPVDPLYPESRIKFILEDTDSPFLITSDVLSDPDHYAETTLIRMDDAQTLRQIAACSTADPETVIHPADLAYVIYTSGSTGMPKGVMVEHKSVKAFTRNHSRVLGITEKNKALQFSSASFDAAVIDLWIPLLNGATLYLYPDNRMIGAPLLDFVRQHGIDILPLIPPTVLASLPADQEISDLQVIGIGGEACPVHTLEHWSPKVRLINAYGPTEATVAVTSFVCQPGYAEKTIGKALPGALLYIFDEGRNEVPDGVAGELFIGGVQVARGYLNRPDLTADRFITDFTGHDQTPVRLYRTGDIVKRMPDGNIVFAGRKDNQVKIRGYRIELGEIESRINRISSVKQAVVLPKENKRGHTLLTAFVVPEDIHAALSVLRNEWRQQLLGQLPAWMVPDHFELLDQMPLNAHGKVDKDKLQLTTGAGESGILQDVTIAPDDYEGLIKHIWSVFLNMDTIDPDDDFFNIGGHSLLLVQIHAAFPQEIKEQLHIPDLYAYPTIRQLAAEIRKRQAETVLSAQEKEARIIRELLQDAQLAADIHITDIPDPGILANPDYIFLTGATGFVGAHLLHELLTQTTAQIYCLVRAESTARAMDRLRDTFKKFRLPWQQEQEGRILPATGDLSLPDFGLDAAGYEMIAARVSVIYHSGSSVSYLQPYPVIKHSNIDGLQQIIRLATTKKTKYLALLSSMGVFSWGRPFTGKTWMYENDDISQNLPAVSRDLGYIKSKWVMEKMIHEAMAKGLPVINFRLGFAVCSGTTGATVMSQWWGSLVRSCVAVGAFPLVMGLKDELTTVDYMAKAIVHIGRNKDAVGSHFHLSPEPANDVSMTDFFAKMNEYYGLDLKGLPYQEWLDLWRNDKDNALYPLLSLFTDDVHEGKSLVEAYENTYYYDRSNTRKFLSDTPLRPPVFDKALMTPYLQYMGIIP